MSRPIILKLGVRKKQGNPTPNQATGPLIPPAPQKIGPNLNGTHSQTNAKHFTSSPLFCCNLFILRLKTN